MKKTSIILSLCLIGLYASAQTGFNFSFSAGTSIPSGDFGATSKSMDAANVHTGLAETGGHADITAAYLFPCNFGLMAYAGGNINAFNTSVYQTLPMGGGGGCSPYPGPNIQPVYTSTIYTAKNYYPIQYLVGPYYSFRLYNGFSLDVKALTGLVTINTPTITETNSAATTTITGATNKGFGYQFGVGINYALSSLVGLSLNIAYTGANIPFTGITKTVYANEQSVTNTYTETQTMSTSLMTATAGVNFSL